MKLIKGLFFAYLILFPFGQLTRISLCPEVNLYLTDVVLTLLILSWGVWRFGFQKKKYQLPPLTLSIFIFSIICLLSLGLASPLLSNREVIVAGLYLVRWLIYAGLYFFISDVKNHLFKTKDILNFLVVIGMAISFFGFAQYFLWPNLKPLEFLNWDPHFYRLVSTFLDPGYTGLILVLSLVIIITLLFEKKKKNWLIGSALITYLALILTHSRSSYLAFVLAMGIISLLKRNLKFFIVVLAILGLSLSFLPQPKGEGGKLTRTYTVDYRFKNWQNAITIAKDNLLLGVGFNAYRYAQRDYGFLEEETWQESHAGAGVDASLLFVLATTGLIGLAAYLWFLTKTISVAFWQRKKTIGIVCLASLGAIVTHSFFLNSLFYPWIMAWLFILLACL